TTTLTEHGGFDFRLDIPANASLGTAVFDLTTNGQSESHFIQIAEFRTPAYAVTLNDDVTHSGAAPLVLGEAIEMNAEAKYHAGGGLAGANIQWNARLEQASYRPPGWDLFGFAPVRPRSNGWRTASTAAKQIAALLGASQSAIEIGVTSLPHAEPSVL